MNICKIYSTNANKLWPCNKFSNYIIFLVIPPARGHFQLNLTPIPPLQRYLHSLPIGHLTVLLICNVVGPTHFTQPCLIIPVSKLLLVSTRNGGYVLHMIYIPEWVISKYFATTLCRRQEAFHCMPYSVPIQNIHTYYLKCLSIQCSPFLTTLCLACYLRNWKHVCVFIST
jgi:hypothetical protein